ncbi:hypothetical protein PORY_002730 [Pneumocystis oryctolagi]|uniref:Uncharacterized protein n=1 Tax=Pneumocystis oryctolagi TaxID=42067 RepID=A0ACB7C8N4_9ASCO|nr:hypothetical protein PORY_002730 [Pneumocystis oryctolagi]
MKPMKSPGSARKCSRQTISNKNVSDKENKSPLKTTVSTPKESIHIKRSKSLGGVEDEQFLKPLMVKQELKPVPNKGILKTSTCPSDFAYDSSCNKNDNHTVIGIMQVALKEHDENNSNNKEMKKSRKSINRRVSFASHASVRLFEKEQEFQSPNCDSSNIPSVFSDDECLLSPAKRSSKSRKLSINNSPKTPSPIKCISPVKFSKLYINSPIPISRGQDFLNDLDQDSSQSTKNLLSSEFQKTVSERQTCDYKDNRNSEYIDEEATMELTDVISKSVFEEKNHKETMSLVDMDTDFVCDEDAVDVTMDLTKVIPSSITQINRDSSVHLTGITDNAIFEKKNIMDEKMDLTLALGKIHQSKNVVNDSNFCLKFDEEYSKNKTQDILVKKKIQSSKSLKTQPSEFESLIDTESSKTNNHIDSVDMDVTETVGAILENMNEINRKDGLTMDFTTTVGNILSANEKTEEKLYNTFGDTYLKEKSNSIRKEINYDSLSYSSHDDPYKSIIYNDDTTVDMNFTKVIPSVLELKDNSALKITEKKNISLNQYDDVTVDMDITKPFNTKLKSPQRVLRSGILAMDSLFGKKTQNISNMRRVSDSFAPVQLGSPKAIKLLKSRKSMSGFEEMKLAGLGSSTSKIVVGKKLAWNDEIFNVDTFVLNDSDIRSRIAQLTPKKNNMSSQSPVIRSVLKNNVFENSESKFKKNSEDTLNNVSVFTSTEKSHKDSDLKKNEYSDHLIEDDDFFPSITLTEFLKMTSISFLDGLTTTKRRESAFFSYSVSKPPNLKELVYASSLTLPALELYQFSCKELQKYIEEGKEVVNKIEEDTSEENPLLFKEYMCATHDIQVIMDGQFKLLKNYSRLYAKGVWYEWRDKLLLGLKEGLQKNLEGLKKDESIINELKPVLNVHYPSIKCKFELLKEKLKHLKTIKEEIDQCDQKELKEVWSNISKINEELQNDAEKLENIKKNVHEIDDQLSRLSEKQIILNREIEDYKKTVEANRCLRQEEIEDIKKTLQILKVITGWEVKSFSPDTAVFIYLGVIETTFNIVKNSTSIKWNGSVKDKIKMFFFDYLEEMLKKCTVKEAPLLICRIWYTATSIWSEFCLLKIRYPMLYSRAIENDQPLLKITAKLQHSIIYEYPNLSNDFIDVNVIYGNVNASKMSKTILEKISTGEPILQSERAFQKQPHVFQNSKSQSAKKFGKNKRWYKEVGLGFKTPKEAIKGEYIDKKCPFVGNVSIRGRILTGTVVSTKMNRTIIIRREYLHYIPKYNRYEKRHKNFAAHLSPAFRVNEGDVVTVGQCRPLSKTVRFNVLRVERHKETETVKQFGKF